VLPGAGTDIGADASAEFGISRHSPITIPRRQLGMAISFGGGGGSDGGRTGLGVGAAQRPSGPRVPVRAPVRARVPGIGRGHSPRPRRRNRCPATPQTEQASARRCRFEERPTFHSLPCINPYKAQNGIIGLAWVAAPRQFGNPNEPVG